jgi:hypothetical protein
MFRLLVALLTPALLVAAPAWQFRYAHQPDQKPEWTEMGRVPAFTITVDGETVSFADAEDGRCRGWLFAARPLELPEAPPARVLASLEYQTLCTMDAPTARSGRVFAFLATREAWQALAEKPEDGKAFDPGRPPKGMLLANVKEHGEDVTDWQPAEAHFGALAEETRQGGSLLAGVAWGTYHFNEERGAFRNLRWTMQTKDDIRWDFWHALDLDRPELAAVRTAVDAKDEPAATRALAAYYRQRETPVVANPVVPASVSVVRRADETLEHTYRLAGCPVYTFKDEVVWNADPFNYNQWPVALNRHSEWRFLAGAYLKTRDEKYAAEWDAQVRHWTKAMPVLIAPGWIEGPFNTPGKTSLSLDAGIRTGQTWFPSFAVFRNSPSVSDETIVAFVRSGWDHGGYLMRDENFRLGSNWGAMESNGLYHLGVMLPEFRDAALWRKTALDRTMAMIDYQVYPDGAQTELAPGYHGVSLRNFLGVMRLAKANDLSVPEDFAQRLQGMFEYYLKITDPEFRTPNLNDSGRGGITGILREGVELFPERQDFLWAAESRRKGTEPEFVSCVMPWAGWVVMRSDWSAEARWLLFDAGPFGTGHQHEDKLGVLVHAFGQPLIAECGVYAYDTSKWRKYCLSTRGHSSVRVDDKDQACRRDRAQFRAAMANTYGFFDSEAATYARDTHVSGYGNPPDKSVVHRRRVLFMKPDLYLVVDDLAAKDGREHEAEIQFLLNADGADLDATGHVAVSHHGKDQPGIAIIPLFTNGVQSRIAQGETEPTVRGFIPKGFEKLEPAPAILYTKTFTKQTTLAWLLVPFQGESVPVQLTGKGQDEVTLRLGDGEEARIRCTPAGLSWSDPKRAFSRDEGPLQSTK